MKSLQIWITAARPKTLPASVGLILLGSTLSISAGFFNPLLFLMTSLTALGIQISTNFANDYFDFIKGADTAERKGPLRVTQAGLVSLSTMKKALCISFGITALLGCYLIWHGGIAMTILVSLSLLLAAAYTGGPFPLAYLGLGDLFAFLFFGPIAVVGTYFLQAGTFSWNAALIGIGAGALSTALLSVNNVRDYQEDLSAKKKTLVVRFGKRFGQIEYLACLAIAWIVPFFFCKTHPFCLLCLLTWIPAFFTIKTLFSYSDPRQLNTVLAQTGQILLLYCLFFCIGWMLS